MPFPGSIADIAQKSAVLLLAGTTVYYMVNIGVLVNRRMELKKEGKLQEELSKYTFMGEKPQSQLHAQTETTPCPTPDNSQPGSSALASGNP
ncbi:hypothetical protein BCR43DRAFT_490402 [Syncephalastrum racemosum]|uniref:Uncharacterized protein n=1 Tax=Syncephalastrum racemosum TaxID=13706 RepID=A0A1X2HFS4_SYNRA|nr:hypothetical protein BCR43DRAFT_490402 [Syncephalastrum racemosum]